MVKCDIEIKDGVEFYFFTENLFLYFYYIFGLLHTELELSVYSSKGLKTVCLFRKDIDVGEFSQLIN